MFGQFNWFVGSDVDQWLGMEIVFAVSPWRLDEGLIQIIAGKVAGARGSRNG